LYRNDCTVRDYLYIKSKLWHDDTWIVITEQ
jgi:hypothetical protein